MNSALLSLKIRYYVGSYLWQERILAKRSYIEAAYCIGVPPNLILDFEEGKIGIPLCYITKLAELYDSNERELVAKINGIQFKLREDWNPLDYLIIAIHRFKVKRSILIN